MPSWIYFCDVSDIILPQFTAVPCIFTVILALNAFNIKLIAPGNSSV